MSDPVGEIIGDYQAFARQQRDRLHARGIDISSNALSHIAVRVPEWDQYVQVRTQLERHAVANQENLWNGRPISLLVLTGQQFQGPSSTPDPVYILFEDFTHVKFYRRSLKDSVEAVSRPFGEGFHHVEGWVPQSLVTATGPNPLPR